MTVRATWDLLKDTGKRWWDNQGMRCGAAVAFYSMLSVAPIVVIVLAVAGWVFGREAAQGELVEQIRGLAGKAGAEVVETALQNAYQHAGTGVVAAVTGVVLLLVGAGGVFTELQDGLNTIWGVKANPASGFWGVIKARFFSYSMVLGVAFLLIVSLIVSAALEAVGRYAGGMSASLAPLFRLLHLLLSIGLLGVLFALMFKFLPDAPISWRDVWVGGMVTAALFGIGKYLIGLYIGTFAAPEGGRQTYGAAASFAVFLIWMYYSAQIFFLGAAFTRAYADRRGSRSPLAKPEELAAQDEAKQKEAVLQV